MSYRDNCGICGESYLDDNLISCGNCGRDFCYRCGDWRERLCSRCQPPADEAPIPARDEPQPQ